VKSTAWSSGLCVSGDGTGVVAHAGSVAVRMLADRVGLTGHLSGLFELDRARGACVVTR
jgi:hypothetical protein